MDLCQLAAWLFSSVCGRHCMGSLVSCLLVAYINNVKLNVFGLVIRWLFRRLFGYSGLAVPKPSVSYSSVCPTAYILNRTKLKKTDTLVIYFIILLYYYYCYYRYYYYYYCCRLLTFC
jgi:hypothetical protein